MIWIHHPQRCCELQAAHCHHRAESCPEAGDGNEALSQLPPAEGAACGSWQDALWRMWHTGLPAVAKKQKKTYLAVFSL